MSNTVESFELASASGNALDQTVNLGSGRTVTICDLIDFVSGILGKPFTLEPESRLAMLTGSEAQGLLAEQSLAIEPLRWRRRISHEKR